MCASVDVAYSLHQLFVASSIAGILYPRRLLQRICFFGQPFSTPSPSLGWQKGHRLLALFCKEKNVSMIDRLIVVLIQDQHNA